MLRLQAAGFRYAEIAQRTGSTYTAVDRRLTEGRGRGHPSDHLPRTDRRRLRAAAFVLSDDIADRDPNDPLVSFVIGMCLYAHLVAAGDAPGP